MSEDDAEQRTEKRRRRIAGQRLSGLLMADSGELDDFRAKRLGRGTPVRAAQLERLRDLLEIFGEALAEPSEERWDRIEEAWHLLHRYRPRNDAREDAEPAPATQMSPQTKDPPWDDRDPASERTGAEGDAPGSIERPGRVGSVVDDPPPNVSVPSGVSPWARPSAAQGPLSSALPVSAPIPLGPPVTRPYRAPHEPLPRAEGKSPALPRAPAPPRPPPPSVPIFDGETFADDMTTNTHVGLLPMLFDEDSESSVVTAITMTADPATRRPGSVLPFQPTRRSEADLAHATATPDGMTLSVYAAFCALLAQSGIDPDDVCARYGVDGPEARQELDRAWYARFDTDPRLHRLWGQLYTSFHRLLLRG